MQLNWSGMASEQAAGRIRTAWPHDLPALRRLFERANHAPYDLSAVTEEKCFAPGVAGNPTPRVFERSGRIEGVAVTCGHWLRILAVLPEARRRGVGSSLLADSEALGAVVVAAEGGNYFTPGVVMTDEISRAFFRRHAYMETRWTDNLEVSLESFAPEGSTPATLRRPSHAEADRVLGFVDREFGRIWRFEAEKAFQRELVPGFIAEEGGEIAAFAVHDVNNRGLGFFGPTGVLPSLRGRGLGRLLLIESLRDLARMGYQRAVIPWTDAIEFYRRSCGAEPAHRFVAFGKQQP
jgi:GNAT superfamily N-acetyltransferase